MMTQLTPTCPSLCPQAFTSFMMVLASDPQHTPTITALGDLYRSRGLLQEALAAYTRAAEVQPQEQVRGP